MTRCLIFSDIHNDAAALKRLMDIEADYYFCAGDLVTFQRGFKEMGEIIRPRAARLYMLPGNHETEQDIADFCDAFSCTNFQGKMLNIGKVNFAGLGYSNPTPFNTPGEFTEEELARRLSDFDKLDPLVMICHAPPLNTRLDRVHEGLHAGSSAIREFIERRQPRDFFCGHIHEAEGVVEKIGMTRAMNVGKAGYLLEL